MPLRYKIPAYVGNALLLFICVFIIGAGNIVLGGLLGALAVLNLLLVYKLDRFSREDVWLAHELQMTKMREELLVERQRVAELERQQATPGVAEAGPAAAEPQPGGGLSASGDIGG